MAIGFLLALAALASSLPDQESEVPKSFRTCATAWRKAHWEPAADKGFDCTNAHFETLSGSAGSTHSMSDASSAAVAVGHAYAVEIASQIKQTRSESGQPDQHTRNAFLDSIVAQRDAYAQGMCGLRYDAWWEGTIRSTVFGACKIRETDELIEDLLAILHDYDPERASGESQ